jgi:hypothetical protein
VKKPTLVRAQYPGCIPINAKRVIVGVENIIDLAKQGKILIHLVLRSGIKQPVAA